MLPVPFIITDEDQEVVTAVDVDIVKEKVAIDHQKMTTPPALGKQRRFKREQKIGAYVWRVYSLTQMKKMWDKWKYVNYALN